VKRRKFIWLSGAGIAAATLPWLTSCQSSQWTSVLSVPSILGQFCSKTELMTIGNSYIERVPQESKISTIEKKLLKGDDENTFEPQSEKSLQDFISKMSERDFSTGQTIILKGWVLSKTEARQCGLFFLTHATS
jgi:hypothetical protein